MDTQVGQTTVGSLIPYFIVIAILMLFIAFCIKMTIATSKIKKQQKTNIKRLKSQGLIQQCVANHVYGLPVAEGLFCTISFFKDYIEFISGTTHVTLSNDKITDMCIKSEAEIQQQYVSSIGGAVGGAMLLGPIGAMIGGRAKKKTTKNTNSYLIITYKNKDNALDYIGLNISDCVWQISKLVGEFRKNNTNSTHVEL